MKQVLKILVLGLFAVVAVGIDVTLWPRLGIQLVNLSLFMVFATSLIRSWRIGFGLAVVIGLLRGLVTVWPAYSFVIAMLASVGISWFFVRRVVAERAALSLLAAVAAGTLVFYVSFWLLLFIVRFIQPSTLLLDVGKWVSQGAIQLVVQPVIVWAVWRWRGGGNFAALTPSLTKPFA